jgi:TIR domain
MNKPSGPSVFISYSHKDQRWFQGLEKHLRALMAEGLFTVRSDRAIRAGEDWYENILRGIAEARIAIVLVSADYLTSEFVRREEIPRLLQRRFHQGMKIIPVLCRPCPWQPVQWLSSMQMRPQDCRPLSARPFPQAEMEFASIAREVMEILRDVECPK